MENQVSIKRWQKPIPRDYHCYHFSIFPCDLFGVCTPTHSLICLRSSFWISYTLYLIQLTYFVKLFKCYFNGSYPIWTQNNFSLYLIIENCLELIAWCYEQFGNRHLGAYVCPCFWLFCQDRFLEEFYWIKGYEIVTYGQIVFLEGFTSHHSHQHLMLPSNLITFASLSQSFKFSFLWFLNILNI